MTTWGAKMVTKTQYVTVKLTMRQLRYVDALVRAALSADGIKRDEITRKERGIISGVEKKLSTLVYQADTDRSIQSARVKAMMEEHNL